MSIAGSVLNILDFIKDKLPLPNRIEGIKNEIDKLQKEKEGLLHGIPSAKNAKRVIWIESRIDKLNGMLKNATNSS